MKTLLTLLLMGAAGLSASGQGRPAKPAEAKVLSGATGPCQQPVATGRYACGHTSMRGMFVAYPDLIIKSATTYTQDNQPGTYRYDVAKRQITWVSGPLAKTGWHAEYFPVGCQYTDAYGAKNSMAEATIEMLDSKKVSVYTGKLAGK